MKENLPDFKGKSVAFYITGTEIIPDWLKDGIVIESPVFENQGNRIFVIGQKPKDVGSLGENDWTSNREAAIAWDSIFYYIVLPSEEYTELIKKDSDNIVKEETNKQNLFQVKFFSYFFLVILMLICLTLLVAIVIWIVKMLL